MKIHFFMMQLVLTIVVVSVASLPTATNGPSLDPTQPISTKNASIAFQQPKKIESLYNAESCSEDFEFLCQVKSGNPKMAYWCLSKLDIPEPCNEIVFELKSKLKKCIDKYESDVSLSSLTSKLVCDIYPSSDKKNYTFNPTPSNVMASLLTTSSSSPSTLLRTNKQTDSPLPLYMKDIGKASISEEEINSVELLSEATTVNSISQMLKAVKNAAESITRPQKDEVDGTSPSPTLAPLSITSVSVLDSINSNLVNGSILKVEEEVGIKVIESTTKSSLYWFIGGFSCLFVFLAFVMYDKTSEKEEDNPSLLEPLVEEEEPVVSILA